MSKRSDYNTSYELEKRLSQSIDKVRGNIEQQHKLRRQILSIRKQRKQINQVPDEVRQWFEEIEEEEEESDL